MTFFEKFLENRHFHRLLIFPQAGSLFQTIIRIYSLKSGCIWRFLSMNHTAILKTSLACVNSCVSCASDALCSRSSKICRLLSFTSEIVSFQTPKKTVYKSGFTENTVQSPPNSPYCPNNSKYPNYSSFWASRPKTKTNWRTGRTLSAEKSEHLFFGLWRTLIPSFFPDAHQNDEIKLGTVPNIPLSNSFVIKYSSRLSCGSNTSHISPYFLAITKIHHFSVATSFPCKICILTCITA